MKVCRNCGFQNQDDFRFCKKCGTPLEEMPTKKSKAPLIIALILLVMILFTGGVLAAVYLVQNDIISLPFGQTQNKTEKNDDEDDENDKGQEDTTVMEEDVADMAPAAETATTEAATTEASTEEGKNFDNVITNEPIKLTTQVTASSELKNGDYDAQNLLDGDGDTAWVEGVKGTGKGEYVVYQAFDKKEYAFGIAIMPGYLKSEQLYYANSEPVELTVNSGDYEEVIDLSGITYQSYDDLKDQMLFYDFSQPIPTSDEITVTISSAVLGLKYDDTCITEMYLYTYPSYGNENQYDSAAWEITHAGVTYGGYYDGYILPESDSSYLTMRDLEGLSADECRLARNEIYARHGRMFDDEELQAYFDGCDWYQGTVPAGSFTDQMLNDYEFANRDLIVEYEKKMGYR